MQEAKEETPPLHQLQAVLEENVLPNFGEVDLEEMTQALQIVDQHEDPDDDEAMIRIKTATKENNFCELCNGQIIHRATHPSLR